MALVLLLPMALPALLAAAVVTHRRAAWVTWSEPIAAWTLLGCGLALLLATRGGESITVIELLRADALASWMLTTIGAVAVVALWGGAMTRGQPDGWFSGLVCLFLASMALAVLSDNLGVMWVGVEATTITTAFLVGYRGGRRALEAAWKYVILGSVGLAIAFLGIVMVYAAARASGHPTLSWTVLMREANGLDPAVMKVGSALAVLGLATKAGLAPMHSWLPDAHSQAPARVSALMSGVLLSVAFYGILRVQALADLVLGPALMRGLLLAAGLGSLAVAAAVMISQRDYKRLLACSSIEHMGLLAIGAAIGGRLALAAVLLHMVGHGLAKAVLFLTSGQLLATYQSTQVEDVRGLLRSRPDLAVPFLAGSVTLLGFPPFALFFTEVTLIIAGLQAGLGWAMALVLLCLFVVFAAFGRQVVAMVFGPGARSDLSLDWPALAPLALALLTTAGLGLAGLPLLTMLETAVLSLGGMR